MTRSIRMSGLAAMLVGALVVAGCGGNDFNNGSDTSVTTEVPASASASVAGFIEYLKQLVVASADMLEPVSVAGFTAPVDDTGDPAPLP